MSILTVQTLTNEWIKYVNNIVYVEVKLKL